jgi:alkanesulfonate monooxygenase SsuD/methylene tetrahydromethanopterin reductase-like flavin-dependent oxidoreductase (luciferase family)
MTMRFGLLVPHFGAHADQDLLIEGARLAEQSGFDSLWVRDHLVFHPHGMEGTDPTFVEPFVALSFLAGVTESIGLGAATINPFRHPIDLAYSVGSLSWLTRRRFDLGVGMGNFQHEFDVIGMGDIKRTDLMKEQVQIARRLWTGESIDHKGDLYSFDDVALKPTPLHPVPVWWGGATPAAARLAVDFCEGWLPGRITFPTFELRMQQIREACAERGRAMVIAGAVPVTSLASSREAALQPLNVPGLIKNANAQKFWVRPNGTDFTSIDELEGSILVGTPDDVVADVRRYEELGAELIIFDLRMRFPEWLEQIRILAEDVLPRLGVAPVSAAGTR